MDYYKGMIIFGVILLFSAILFVPLRQLLLEDNPFNSNAVLLTGVIYFFAFFGIIFGILALIYIYPKYKNKLVGGEKYKGMNYY